MGGGVMGRMGVRLMSHLVVHTVVIRSSRGPPEGVVGVLICSLVLRVFNIRNQLIAFSHPLHRDATKMMSQVKPVWVRRVI